MFDNAAFLDKLGTLSKDELTAVFANKDKILAGLASELSQNTDFLNGKVALNQIKAGNHSGEIDLSAHPDAVETVELGVDQGIGAHVTEALNRQIDLVLGK